MGMAVLAELPAFYYPALVTTVLAIYICWYIRDRSQKQHLKIDKDMGMIDDDMNGNETQHDGGMKKNGKLKIDKDMETLQQRRISNNPMNAVNMDLVFTPESEINVEDILMDTPVGAKETPTESSHFDVNVLVAGRGSKHMLLTPTGDAPQTQLTPDGTASMASMDMGMIDGLISDLVAIEEDVKKEEEEEET
eukprot:532663_1